MHGSSEGHGNIFKRTDSLIILLAAGASSTRASHFYSLVAVFVC